MACSQLSMRPSRPLRWNWLVAPEDVRLLNERHLVDFAQGGQSRADFAQGRIAQEQHAGVPRGALDFRSGTAVDDHLANVIGKIEKFGDGGAAAVAAAGALETAGAFGKLESAPFRGIEPGFLQNGRRIGDGL